MSASPYNPDKIRSFGRVRGRKLRITKQTLFDTLLPKLQLHLSPPPERGRIKERVEWGAFYKETWLEIGFGGGEHLAMQAQLHPDIGMIGCEPFVNGISDLLVKIDKEKIQNIRIFTGDARDLIDALPDASIAKAFILFPDPWPKSRHHKRRLINHELLKSLARILKPGAELLIATDHEDYLTWILEHILSQDDFEWTAKEKSDWQNPPKDWVTTKYQAKALREGRVPHWLHLIRN